LIYKIKAYKKSSQVFPGFDRLQWRSFYASWMLADQFSEVVLTLVSLDAIMSSFYGCVRPPTAMVWGKRWMYKENPELSEGAIRYTKTASLTAIVVLRIIFGVVKFS
jgi:hypothetical protein